MLFRKSGPACLRSLVVLSLLYVVTLQAEPPVNRPRPQSSERPAESPEQVVPVEPTSEPVGAFLGSAITRPRGTSAGTIGAAIGGALGVEAGGTSDKRELQPTHRIAFQVRVYEVELSLVDAKIMKDKKEHSSQILFNEFLKPLKEGREEIRLDKGHVTSWTIKKPIPPEALSGILGKGLTLVSEPKVNVVGEGQARFDYGGSIPQVKLQIASGPNSGSYDGLFRPLATQFAVQAEAVEGNRVLVSVSFDPGDQDMKKRHSKPDSSDKPAAEQLVRATAELGIGQSLCLSDFGAQRADHNESLLIIISPESIAEIQIEVPHKPAVIAEPVKRVSREVVVEDRWPISDIKVGQRVAVIPIWIGKTSLSTSLAAVYMGAQKEYGMIIQRIELLPGNKGRRVTLTTPEGKNKELGDLQPILDLFQSATTNCVLTPEEISMQDFRWLDDVHAAIDPAHRPKPAVITQGDSFIGYGLQGFVPDKDKSPQTNGPLTVTFLDNDDGGIYKVTAKETGLTRLLQMQGSEADGDGLNMQIRRIEYLVKADTRELELHLKQQFPTANVTITSLGANALILSGKVATDEDVTAITELAGEFTAKVLNRLKVTPAKPARATSSLHTETSPVIGNQIVPAQYVDPYSDPDPNAARRHIPQTNPTPHSELELLRQEIRELRAEIRKLSQSPPSP